MCIQVVCSKPTKDYANNDQATELDTALPIPLAWRVGAWVSGDKVNLPTNILFRHIQDRWDRHDRQAVEHITFFRLRMTLSPHKGVLDASPDTSLRMLLPHH